MFLAQRLSLSRPQCLRSALGVGRLRGDRPCNASRRKQLEENYSRRGSHTRASSDAAASDGSMEASMEGSMEESEPAVPEAVKKERKAAEFALRVGYGTALGLVGCAIILYGKLPFVAWMTLAVYQATIEYYGFITSKGISKGMTPPPPAVSVLTTILCVSMPVVGYLVRGKTAPKMAVASFVLLAMQLLTVKKPKFSQLASLVFGLFYCGWLPSFWVKLRMLSVPVPAAAHLAGMALPGWVMEHLSWTVGLVATLASVACTIAADTGAYFVGKSLGRTKLTDISPKKTVEGALGGLASSVAVALAFHRFLAWPAQPLAAVALGVVVFGSSLFGDLIESVMKRDAGMKDSGNLIPGHGGLLDRFDSYIFTGAVAYFLIIYCLPQFGLAA